MDKQSTLRQLDDGFAQLLGTVQPLDERTMSKRFYGEWNIKDILAHVTGWHQEMTAAMERMARGERPTPEGIDYTNADDWNSGFAAAMKPQNGSTVLAFLQQSFANYRRAADAIADDRYGEGKTVNRLLETSGYGHYAEHLPEIQKFAAQAKG